LQAVNHGCQRGGSRDHHPKFPLYTLRKAGTGQDFRKESFRGEKEDTKIGGVGRVYIFIINILCRQFKPPFQKLPRLFTGQAVPALPGTDKPFVIFFGKFGINGEQYGLFFFSHPFSFGRTWQPYRHLHPFLTPWLGYRI
jgi:hypothetical protein